MLSCIYGAKYLAVLDLEPAGLSDTEAKILTQRLTSKMIELSDFTVVERANINKILKEQKFQHSGCTDSECAVQIGQLLNADVSVIGTASKFGRTYTLDCRIINVEKGEALESASYTHTGEIDELVKDGIESIAHELLNIPYKRLVSPDVSAKTSSGYGALLEINSNPSGADVYIEGNFFDITPVTLEDFPVGTYQINIDLINYYSYNEEVKLFPRGRSLINADLICKEFDCAFQCGGTAKDDGCGCGKPGPSGCDNTCGSTLEFDECGICGGANTDGESCIDCNGDRNGNAWESDCGCVDASNTGHDCDDCFGIPNGDSIIDKCGICGGDGSSCDAEVNLMTYITLFGCIVFSYYGITSG